MPCLSQTSRFNIPNYVRAILLDKIFRQLGVMNLFHKFHENQMVNLMFTVSSKVDNMGISVSQESAVLWVTWPVLQFLLYHWTDVQAIFDSLIDNIEPDVMDLALYMERPYIRGTPAQGRRRAMALRFAPELWNTYNQVLAGQHRTTNIVEGWHSRFQKHIVTLHSSVWKLMEFIKNDQRNNEIIIIQILGGHLNVGNPIKRSYLQNLSRVEEIVRNYNHYNEEGHTRTYLKAVSYHLKLYEDEQTEEIE
ncbi:hypothetical protein ANN_06751 [Periplaneta americana]|uniref:MULE domain-containing protein n=1 Tax=Periplaneta americana TaxID=6978 RepID=A0ABQ8TG99_PERAM|nr:hypothetical protein ANN_06751 [Periplaneta americana]